MAAYSPFLRPLGIAAGGLGTVQAIIWGILSLLAILLYTGVMNDHSSNLASNQFQKALVGLYFSGNDSSHSNIMTPGEVVVWTSIYFATSVIWLVISGFLLYDSYNFGFTSMIIIGWVAVSAVVAAIDLAGTVAFGVDYNRVQSELDKVPYPNNILKTDMLLAPIFMMIMCARGFILWIMNVGLVIYLGVAASKLHKKGSPNLLKDPDYSSHLSSSNNPYRHSLGASIYTSPKADSFGQGRPNPAFRPDAVYGWDTQSPTVGNQNSVPRNFPQKNSFNPQGVVNPIQPIPRAGKSLPIPADHLPTPQPDYSPPPRRQKHEPNMYEAPARPVLKKSNSQRQLYF